MERNSQRQILNALCNSTEAKKHIDLNLQGLIEVFFFLMVFKFEKWSFFGYM